MSAKRVYYSKKSLIWRILLTLVLGTAIGLVIAFRVPISKWVYGWEEGTVTNAEFEVHFIDVGQGDSSLIKLSDGKTMLIDCGPKVASESLVDYIKGQGVQRIDYFLLTHPDADHIGGGVEIFSNFDVKNFYRPMLVTSTEENAHNYPLQPNETKTYENVLQAFYAEQESGGAQMFYSSDSLEPITGEDYIIKILYPDKPYPDSNASSAVVKATLGGQSFMFMGDAGKDEEERLISLHGEELGAKVLKVGHHGSKTSTSEQLLQCVRPSYAVISVAKENSYSHPAQETLTLLQNYNAQIFKTSDSGSIVFAVKGGKLFTGGSGKMIDYVLWSVVLGVAILLIWGLPSRKKKVSKQKDVKN